MSFKPIGPLPHLREGRRTIPKEATLFEYLKSINFAENLRLELTTQNIDQYIDVNYFGHVYEDNLDEIRLDTLSSVIDDVVSFINYTLRNYSDVLSDHVTFRTHYFKNYNNAKYESFYEPITFDEYSGYRLCNDRQIDIETKDIVESTKNGKLIMENIWFERGQIPTYTSYDDEFVHMYINQNTVVIPIEYMYFLPHKDNVMVLCMKFFTSLHVKASKTEYCNHSYITGHTEYGEYHVMFVDDDGKIHHGFAQFLDDGPICSFPNKYYKDFNRPDAARFAINKVEDAICDCDRDKSVQVHMKIMDYEGGNEFDIDVYFRNNGDIDTESSKNYQIISFSNYEPRYEADGTDMIYLLKQSGILSHELNMLKNIELYYDEYIVPNCEAYFKYFKEGRKYMIANYHEIVKGLEIDPDNHLFTNGRKTKLHRRINELTQTLKKIMAKKSKVIIETTLSIIHCNRRFPWSIQLPAEIWEHILGMNNMIIRIKYM